MRSPSGRFHDWDAIIAQARLLPGSWVVALRDEPARLVRTIRERAHPSLRFPGGRLEAQIRNGYLDSWGRRRGDIYVRYVPTPHDQVGSELGPDWPG